MGAIKKTRFLIAKAAVLSGFLFATGLLLLAPFAAQAADSNADSTLHHQQQHPHTPPLPLKHPLPHYGRPRVVLVLGGGGFRAVVAHLGVLEELEQSGILKEVDLLVGCSAGAIVGASYANHRAVAPLKAAISHYLPSSIFSFVAFKGTKGVFSLHGLKRLLRASLTVRTFQELQMPFVAVATNLTQARLAVLGSGPLVPAICASAAIPGLFTPVRLGNDYFADGSVLAPDPVQVAKQIGAKFIIACTVEERVTNLPPPKSMGEVVIRSTTMRNNIFSKAALKLADEVINVYVDDVSFFSTNKMEYTYKLGQAAARKHILTIKRKLAKL